MFSSYLDNRTQKCFVNGNLSTNRTVKCGVPQGTILGPLLILLYINDLPNCLSKAQSRMYADDTHLTFASDDMDTVELALNRDLESVNRWFIANKLTLNTTKTEFMLIGSRQKLKTISRFPSLSINDNPIDQVTTTKSLGVYIDENLSWGNHINKLAKKIASGI